ncbi:MAG: type II secretion system protein J [Phycisphaerae bacterium]
MRPIPPSIPTRRRGRAGTRIPSRSYPFTVLDRESLPVLERESLLVPTHSRPPRGFSLIETAIAISILGLGLLMMAAIFPVALTQHRQSADRARALDQISQAEAMLHNRLNPETLWFDPAFLDDGIDSPWNVLPMANIEVGANWLDLTNYSAELNGRVLLPTISELQLLGTDILSDRIVPMNDAQAAVAEARLAWIGFYRQMANGTRAYTAAICKQNRNQVFLMQLVDPSLAQSVRYRDPAATGLRLRLPAPWRVTVSRLPGTQILFNVPTVPATQFGLAQLAPRGSKIMILGFPIGSAPAGRILTVAETEGANRILILEDLGNITFDFDVWLFPPAIGARHSPLLEWKVSL